MADWQDLKTSIFNWLSKSWRALVLVVLATVAIGIFTRCSIEHDLFRDKGPIDRWQTLITGVIAIGAAFIGAYFINAQTKLARSQEDERRRRRHAATRATMPLTLSALMEYARHCGRALRLLHLSTQSAAVGAEKLRDFELPPLPGEKIAALAEIIEAGDPKVGKAIAVLLSKLQVQDGRLRSTKAEILDPHSHTRSVLNLDLETYIIDAADLYARCEDMLDYARDQAETVDEGEPNATDLKRALTLMGFHEEAFGRVRTTIDRRYGAVVQPIDA